MGNIHLIEYSGVQFTSIILEEERNILTLYIYNKIIPYILESYRKSLEKKEWNTTIKKSL